MSKFESYHININVSLGKDDDRSISRNSLIKHLFMTRQLITL